MKRIFVFTIALLITVLTHSASSQKLKVKELNYGISKDENLYRTKRKASPSGHHNTTSERLRILKRTDTILAEILF